MAKHYEVLPFIKEIIFSSPTVIKLRKGNKAEIGSSDLISKGWKYHSNINFMKKYSQALPNSTIE